jgi:hypothetical protein
VEKLYLPSWPLPASKRIEPHWALHILCGYTAFDEVNAICATNPLVVEPFTKGREGKQSLAGLLTRRQP